MNTRSNLNFSIFERNFNLLTQIILSLIAIVIAFVLLSFALNRNNLISALNKLGERNTDNTVYVVGKVIDIGESQDLNNFFEETTVKVELEDNLEVSTNVGSYSKQFFREGRIILEEDQNVVLLEVPQGEGKAYHLVDIYRLDSVIYLILAFILLAVIFGGTKGFSSFVGLVVTMIILVAYIVPNILAGKDPVWISFVGSTGIALTSIYLAHGFNRRTTIALVSTMISILISIAFSLIAVNLTSLNGTGSEESLFVAGLIGNINLKGLLLGGIIIGTLGILDDITTAQAAVIEELKLTDYKLKFGQLLSKALSVGKEHIASLINTIVLAYAGASFPLFILIVANLTQPLWITLNGEFIIEELVRTIVGSSTLILAVPITSIIASYYYSRLSKETLDTIELTHTH
jgi:uncharacterized membrane protein